MTNLPASTRALEHLTLALISLDDAVTARDYFRNTDVGVDIQVAIVGDAIFDNLPAAAFAGEQLRDAAHDPELVLQALVQRNVKQVIGALENLQAVVGNDLKEVSGFYAAQEEARMRAAAKQRLTEALSNGKSRFA